jgi:hypothetical protein
MSLNPSSPYETWEDVEYFRLHPRPVATCDACPSVTCACPAGIDIPKVLSGLHGRMVDQMRHGLVPPPIAERPQPVGGEAARFAARVVRRELPASLRPGATHLCRLNLENCGRSPWHARRAPHRAAVRLWVLVDGREVAAARLRHTVFPGARCHFVFELTAPTGRERVNVHLRLARDHPLLPVRGRGLDLFRGDVPIVEET